MTPMAALRSATLEAAAFVGLGHELGSIEVGKLADFVLLGSDPLESIENVADTRAVVLRGRLLDAERLREVCERVARDAAVK